jgi:gliding motility-associated-like protein
MPPELDILPIARLGGFVLALLFSCCEIFGQAPSIITVVPAKGNVGSSVLITGTGFGVAATNNAVYFGAVRAAISTAGTTSVTVTVPAGSSPAPISVINTTTGLQASSGISFVTTFSGGVLNECSFDQSMTDVTTSISNLQPSNYIVADFNNDGKPDLAFSYLFGDFAGIIQNNSTPGINSFGKISKLSLGAGTSSGPSIAVGDLDGDGLLDLILGVGSPASGLVIFKNTSSGSTISFALKLSVAASGLGQVMSVVDFDLDGKPEILTTGTIFQNTSTPGNISFTAATHGISFEALTVADLDLDKKPDLVYLRSGAMYARRYIGSSSPVTTASFSPESTITPFAGGQGLAQITSADLTGDNKPEVVAVGSFIGQDSVYVYKNILAATIPAGAPFPAATFASRVPIPMGYASAPLNLCYSSAVKLGDMDGDGTTDLVVADKFLNNINAPTVQITVLANKNPVGVIDAALFNRKSYEAGISTISLALADMDTDGKLDIVSDHFAYARSVFVFRNQMAENNCSLVVSTLAPQVDGFTPAAANAGTQIIISGQNFNSNVAKTEVYFGNIKAAINSGSTTSLTVTVPSGIYYCKIIVLNKESRQQGTSSNSFIPTFDGTHTLTASSYNKIKTLTVVSGAGGAFGYSEIGDLDQDGKYDLISRYAFDKVIHVARNASTSSNYSFPSDGQFKTQIQYGSYLPISDLNGDGKQEMVGGAYNYVSAFQNNYAGGLLDSTSFGSSRNYLAGGFNDNVLRGSIDDMDGDGRPEIIVGGYKNTSDNYASFSIQQNLSANGAIALASKINFPSNISDYLSVGDMNGDHRPEVVFPSGNTAVVYQNLSTPGNISTSTFNSFTLPLGSSLPVYQTEIADIDGDNKPDIILSGFSKITILRNIHTTGAMTPASFAAPINILNPGFDSNIRMKISDLDGDGKPDFAVADISTIYLYKNTSIAGTISFDTPLSRGTTGALGFEVADLNGDSKPELIAFIAGNVDILYEDNGAPANQPPVIAKSISQVTYSSGTVTIDNALTVSDANDIALTGATIEIDNSTFSGLEDKLIFLNQNGILGTYNGVTGVLTLTGTASVANYQSALRSVQYQDIASSPVTDDRTIRFLVTDGKDNSGKVAYDLIFSATPPNDPGNTAPLLNVPVLATVTKGKAIVDLKKSITDAEGNLNLSSFIVLEAPESGALATITSGILTVDYGGVTFTGDDHLTIQACDSAGLCSAQDITVHVTGEIIIYNGVSANGDLQNPIFRIENIDALAETQKNHVSIYNRWGDIVFEVDNYDNNTHVFKGLNKNGNELAAGSYFYKIDFVGGKPSETGYLSLKK